MLSVLALQRVMSAPSTPLDTTAGGRAGHKARGLRFVATNQRYSYRHCHKRTGCRQTAVCSPLSVPVGSSVSVRVLENKEKVNGLDLHAQQQLSHWFKTAVMTEPPLCVSVLQPFVPQHAVFSVWTTGSAAVPRRLASHSQDAWEAPAHQSDLAAPVRLFRTCCRCSGRKLYEHSTFGSEDVTREMACPTCFMAAVGSISQQCCNMLTRSPPVFRQSLYTVLGDTRQRPSSSFCPCCIGVANIEAEAAGGGEAGAGADGVVVLGLEFGGRGLGLGRAGAG